MDLLRQAAKRERSGTGVWWGVMAAVGGAAAVALLWRSHPMLAKAAAALWALGWAAPLAATASLRSPEEGGPLPQAGGGTWDQWRDCCRLVGRLLAWGEVTCPDAEMRKRLASAQKDLRDTLGAHPLKEDLERVCLRTERYALAPLRTWFWREWLAGSAAELRREAERAAAEAEDEAERVEIWSGAMEDAAAKAMRCLYPSILATEQEAGADACVLAAWQGARPGDPLVELAMALCLEWGPVRGGWRPAWARARAMRMARTGRASGDWPGSGEEASPGEEPVVVSGAWVPTAAEEETPAAGGDAGTAADVEASAAEEAVAAAAGAGASRHRVKIRTRRSRHRHGRGRSPWGRLKGWAEHEIWRAWNIFATFSQRVRYKLKLWRQGR